MDCESCKNSTTCRFKDEGKTKEYCNFFILAEANMEIEYKCIECGSPKFVPEMHDVGRCHCSGELEEIEQSPQNDEARDSTEAPGYAYKAISMTYELNGRCMWHSDCIPGRGNGIMKLRKREVEHDLMICLHCGKLGYYPVGGLGMIEAEEQV